MQQPQPLKLESESDSEFELDLERSLRVTRTYKSALSFRHLPVVGEAKAKQAEVAGTMRELSRKQCELNERYEDEAYGLMDDPTTRKELGSHAG